MSGTRFTVKRTVIGGFSDVAHGGDLQKTIIDDLSTDLFVTISDVEMHLAAWLNPPHWSDDWIAKLGLQSDADDEAVEAAVAALIEHAHEQR